MGASNLTKTTVFPLILGWGLLLGAGDGDSARVLAQAPGPSPQAAPASETKPSGQVDPYDRGALFYAYQRSGTSGLQRGQEIYYMRCWMCHSEYVMATDPLPAPSLRDLFKRRDAQYVERMIRAGGSRMPSFVRETLTDEELKDLVTFLQEKCGTFATGGGCFDEHNPPPNPLYRYSREIAPTHLGPTRSGT